MKVLGFYALSSLLCLVASTPVPDTLHSSTRQAGRSSSDHERSHTLRRRQMRSSSDDEIKSRPTLDLTKEQLAAEPPSQKTDANYRVVLGRTPPSHSVPRRNGPKRGGGRRDIRNPVGVTNSFDRVVRGKIHKRDVSNSMEGLPIIDLPRPGKSGGQPNPAQEPEGGFEQPQESYEDLRGPQAEAGYESPQLVQTDHLSPASERRASGGDKGAVTSFNFANVSPSEPTACDKRQFNVQSDMWVALSAQVMGRRAFDNPYCGQQVIISYGGNRVGAWVADKCPGCDRSSVVVSPLVMEALNPGGKEPIFGAALALNPDAMDPSANTPSTGPVNQFDGQPQANPKTELEGQPGQESRGQPGLESEVQPQPGADSQTQPRVQPQSNSGDDRSAEQQAQALRLQQLEKWAEWRRENEPLQKQRLVPQTLPGQSTLPQPRTGSGVRSPPKLTDPNVRPPPNIDASPAPNPVPGSEDFIGPRDTRPGGEGQPQPMSNFESEPKFDSLSTMERPIQLKQVNSKSYPQAPQ